MNSFAKTSVSVKILTSGGSWVITLPEEPAKRPQADKRKIPFEAPSRLSGKRYGFDNIVGGVRPLRGRNNPTHAHTKITQSSFMTKKKTNTVILPRTCSPNGSKILSQGFIRRLERVRFWRGAYEKTLKQWAGLPDKSIKELKAENTQGVKKFVYVCRSWKAEWCQPNAGS